MKIIAYIAAAILIFFGVLFVWGAGGAQGGGWTWVCGGALSVLFGFGLIWFASQRLAKPGDTNVALKVDLPAQTKIEQMNCKNCGGALKAENVKMIAGAPTVECPYCGTTYQLGRKTQVVGPPCTRNLMLRKNPNSPAGPGACRPTCHPGGGAVL